jgi:hypothetical protein
VGGRRRATHPSCDFRAVFECDCDYAIAIAIAGTGGMAPAAVGRQRSSVNCSDDRTGGMDANGAQEWLAQGPSPGFDGRCRDRMVPSPCAGRAPPRTCLPAGGAGDASSAHASNGMSRRRPEGSDEFCHFMRGELPAPATACGGRVKPR